MKAPEGADVSPFSPTMSICSLKDNCHRQTMCHTDQRRKGWGARALTQETIHHAGHLENPLDIEDKLSNVPGAVKNLEMQGLLSMS